MWIAAKQVINGNFLLLMLFPSIIIVHCSELFGVTVTIAGSKGEEFEGAMVFHWR
jgi:hypothetical protein